MTKAHRILLVLLSLALAFTGLSAAITQYYAFKEINSTYEEVWGSYLTDAMQDEGLAGPIEIGFSFPYAGSTFTQVKVSSNGWLNLGSNLNLPYYGNDLSYLNIRPIVAPLWDDISLETGAVQYATTGTAPYRVFFVQWQAAKWNYNGSNEYSFLVRLHESGQVDMLYGPHLGVPNNPSASIGMNMAPGGSGNFFSILPGFPASYVTGNSYNDIGLFPEQGTLYTFMARTSQATNIAALSLDGYRFGDIGHMSYHVLTFGNAGTQPIMGNTAVAYLMNGEEILTMETLPTVAPGYFGSVGLGWFPPSVGDYSLTAKIDLADDADSLNDVTMPIHVNIITANPEGDTAPAIPSLWLKASPNPFEDRTYISYELKQAEQVKLEVYNLKGQKVCVLQDEVKSAGLHSTGWNGRDSGGKAMPEGIYFLRLNTDKSQTSKKLILLR